MALLLRFLAALAATAAARARRGPLRPSWSFMFEATIAFLRATSRVASGRPPLEQRAVWNALRAPPSPVMRRIARTPVDAGGVPSTWFVPKDGHGDAVVLYIHGGSFIYGSLETHGEMITRIALAARARVLAIEYRLVPEAPFPAALDDVRAAYTWLRAQGVPAGKIVLAGDSAGGNLSVAALLALREHGEPLPAGAIPICPWVDPARTGGSLDANEPIDWGEHPDMVHNWLTLHALTPEAERAFEASSAFVARVT